MIDTIYKEFLDDRIIYISGQVNVNMSNDVVQKLLYFEKKSPGTEIKIYINCSPGGDVYAGLAMIDTMRYITSPISIVAMGYVASMASVLLSCGTKGKRFIQKGAHVMIHQVSSGVQGKNDDIQVAEKNTERLNTYLLNLLAENCGKTYEVLKEDCRNDYWMDSSEAVEYGIADNIIEPTEKKEAA